MAVISIIISITCFIQVAFYAAIFSRYLRRDHEEANIDNARFKPVSIVICARNEAENIKKYLPIVLAQDYIKYEVIVVDDGSTDGSAMLLAEMETIYEHLLTFRIEPEDKAHRGKKQALMHGVALAKYDYILVTDGDCCPATSRWLQYMTAPLFEGADLVLGLSPHFPDVSGIRHYFRAEALFVAMHYTGFALAGIPYMGVGRNMAYTRKIFDQHDMQKHWDLLSGDDDLFINDVADSSSIAICSHPDGYTLSEAPTSVRSWMHQKLRHYTTGYRYNMLQQIWLGYYWLSSLLLFALLPVTIAMLCSGLQFGIFFAVILFMTVALRWYVTAHTLYKMGERRITWLVPIFDIMYTLSVWLLSPLSRIMNFKWK